MSPCWALVAYRGAGIGGRLFPGAQVGLVDEAPGVACALAQRPGTHVRGRRIQGVDRPADLGRHQRAHGLNRADQIGFHQVVGRETQFDFCTDPLADLAAAFGGLVRRRIDIGIELAAIRLYRAGDARRKARQGRARAAGKAGLCGAVGLPLGGLRQWPGFGFWPFFGGDRNRHALLHHMRQFMGQQAAPAHAVGQVAVGGKGDVRAVGKGVGAEFAGAGLGWRVSVNANP